MAKLKPLQNLMAEYLNEAALPSTWCPGCGIGTTMGGVVRAVDASEIDREKFVLVTGIGCYGGAGTYIRLNDIHALHGRCPAYATGLKLARPDLHPILLMGDGDSSAIGGNHLIHAARRNINITAIIMNNHIYGMTGGQYSPTTPIGTKAATAPFGLTDHPFDICRLVAAAGGTFVARTTVYHVAQLASFIGRAIAHPGFSLVEVESICPTYFGRRKKMGSPVQMLHWLKDNTVSLNKAKEMSPEELTGKVVTGVFVEEHRTECATEYQELIKRVQAK